MSRRAASPRLFRVGRFRWTVVALAVASCLGGIGFLTVAQSTPVVTGQWVSASGTQARIAVAQVDAGWVGASVEVGSSRGVERALVESVQEPANGRWGLVTLGGVAGGAALDEGTPVLLRFPSAPLIRSFFGS